jgi:hypothetical protein
MGRLGLMLRSRTRFEATLILRSGPKDRVSKDEGEGSKL